MPQLDFANPLTIAQIVWLAIIFFTLYLLLSRWALPQVAEVLEVRLRRSGGTWTRRGRPRRSRMPRWRS